MSEKSQAIQAIEKALKTLENAEVADNNKNAQEAGVEARTLEFWRAIVAECFGTFLFVFITFSTGTSGHNSIETIIGRELAIGCAYLTLIFCFVDISGAHLNPAITLALTATRRISPLRAMMFVAGQCGGAIAGAALVYGSSSGSLILSTGHPNSQPWQHFIMDVTLSLPIAFCYFVINNKSLAFAPAVAAAYLACTSASLSTLNPAAALGPAFVLHRWGNHWIHWFGPLLGAVLAGMLWEFILNPNRSLGKFKSSNYGDDSSMNSDPNLDNYDDLDRPYSTHDPYDTPGGLIDKNEPIYSPRSLYNQPVHAPHTPALTRANLNRSQSVYAKYPPPQQQQQQQQQQHSTQAPVALYSRLPQVTRVYASQRLLPRPEPIYSPQQKQQQQQHQQQPPPQQSDRNNPVVDDSNYDSIYMQHQRQYRMNY